MHPRIIHLKKEIELERNRLLSHPVYTQLKDLTDVQQFAQIHIFAVWDFMSLLKSLQKDLTSVSIPWFPIADPETRFLINEIVLGEESDVDEKGNRISHFELYRNAMHQMGASTAMIDSFLLEVKSSGNVLEIINSASLPIKVKKFLQFTFEIALYAPTHIKAAVFTFGREDLIPSMFHQLLEQLFTDMPEKISVFKYYIERHIEVDGEHHSHLAMNMVANLCGDDPAKWDDALIASKKALEIRYELWDAVIEELQTLTI